MSGVAWYTPHLQAHVSAAEPSAVETKTTPSETKKRWHISLASDRLSIPVSFLYALVGPLAWTPQQKIKVKSSQVKSSAPLT